MFDNELDRFGTLDGKKLRIINLQVGFDVQLEYSRIVMKSRNLALNEKELAAAQIRLVSPETSLLNKKKLLVRLAHSEKVDTMRFLEQYSKDAPEEIRTFAHLASLHCQMRIESDLSDEPQIVVSSGLGGEENRLRFFVAFIPSNRAPLSAPQKQLMQKEFTFVLEQFGAGSDTEIDFSGKYPKFTILVPFKTHPLPVVQEGIKLCNELGQFLSDQALISNVKCLDDEEIDKIVGGGPKKRLRGRG